jgi:hypothetical protein
VTTNLLIQENGLRQHLPNITANEKKEVHIIVLYFIQDLKTYKQVLFFIHGLSNDSLHEDILTHIVLS